MKSTQKSISGFGGVTPEVILKAVKDFKTPFYLYDETVISNKCNEVLAMPHAFGFEPRYAMKANPNATILNLIVDKGFGIDASSLNEVTRASMAGISEDKIMLTTQEVPEGKDRENLEDMIGEGLRYNVCSLRQLNLIKDFASDNNISLSIRVHPGVGSGESETRDTGSPYSCFGIHLSDVPEVMEIATKKGIVFDQVHTHIGSGGDPKKWRENIDRQLKFMRDFFPDATRVSFGGGLKEARMPHETSAEINFLGEYAMERIQEFQKDTGKELTMEIEPGTYLMANAGYIVTKVIDLKKTDKCDFIITNGGMEVNARPLLYGSQHPFYLISKQGEVLSTEELRMGNSKEEGSAVVGRCCESGDAQTLDETGKITPRVMAKPDVGDYLVIGGAGAYCSEISPINYNSHLAPSQMLLTKEGILRTIRKEQRLIDVIANDVTLGF